MTPVGFAQMQLAVDSGIHTQRDLAGILPDEVADRIDEGFNGLLGEMQSAAALRVLATVENEGWRRFVEPYRIDWDGMLNGWARREMSQVDSVRIRIEAAASLGGYPDASPDLLYVARALDRENFLAFVDALRIVADGGLRP